jgi:cyclic beta-1,2-glucan synthetase
VSHDVQVALTQTLLAITMLPHQAWLMVDAVSRTLWRLYASKRNLLEWVAAAHQGYGLDLELRSFFRHLRWGIVLAAVAGSLLLVLRPGAWPAAAPIVLLWMLSPAVAWRISLPPRVRHEQLLSPSQARGLRLIARHTWRFFEVFVHGGNHHLPPDNLQEDPEPVEAHRTSPTNIGLYLLSATAARDFGWIGTLTMLERLEATLKTMATMRRLRGHFFNWYDTQDLRPLDPMYVSTVDSGNLAGHLIALAQACRERMHRPLADRELLEGVRDALELLLGALDEVELPERTQTVTVEQVRVAAEQMLSELADVPSSLPAWSRRLAELDARAETLLDMATTLASDAAEGSEADVPVWARAVLDCVRSHAHDLATLVPWCARLCAESGAAGASGGDGPSWPKRIQRPRKSMTSAVRSRRKSSGRPPDRKTKNGPCSSRSWSCPERRPRRWSIARQPSRCRPSGWRGPWTSASCSTPRASCSPSATAWPMARSTPAATTCWPPKRDWRASWR